LRHDLRLSRPAAAQIRQQVVDRQRQTGRTAVDDNQVAGTVADAGGRDAEQLAERIAWHDLRAEARVWGEEGRTERYAHFRLTFDSGIVKFIWSDSLPLPPTPSPKRRGGAREVFPPLRLGEGVGGRG